MRIIIDNNYNKYDTGEAVCFKFNDRDVLKEYGRRYSLINFEDSDPNFIFVREKHTGREYYQELGYSYDELRKFLYKSVIDNY